MEKTLIEGVPFFFWLILQQNLVWLIYGVNNKQTTDNKGENTLAKENFQRLQWRYLRLCYPKLWLFSRDSF